MKSSSIKSPKEDISKALEACRQHTLFLTYNLNRETLTTQAHPDFSPIGWHLGHIAFTEAYWVLEKLAGLSPLFPQYKTLFTADGLPKQARQNLPPLADIQNYLNTVRLKTLDYLATANIDKQLRLWWWLIQHESQHAETIAIVKKLHSTSKSKNTDPILPQSSFRVNELESQMIKVAAGEFIMGSNQIKAQDNERTAHQVYLDSYLIDIYPVTIAQYQKFISSQGYQNNQYWSTEGWQWLQQNKLTQPLYWSDDLEDYNHPVCGVSYYEAEAYANFVGKRLPTEAEWEKAAQQTLLSNTEPSLDPINHENDIAQSNNIHLITNTTAVNSNPANRSVYGCYDMLGNVWEWTSSWFEPYPEFSSFPYKGYSQVYFDNLHRVLKGGSYITQSWAMRTSFRNWYHPWVRQIFAGFRCVQDIE